MTPQASATAPAPTVGTPAIPALKHAPFQGLRPEKTKDEHWVSPQDFFKTIRYVTMKITNGCNLKCSYCNVDADVPSTPRMSLETYKKIATLLIENSTESEVMLEFHGGEPLLMSDEWYEEACGFAMELARKHNKKVVHPMQTNGTRLTEARLERLTKLPIRIGISFDGPPHINDRHRMGGKGVEKTIRMLVERKVPFGMILVLSHSNWADMKEVMEYYQQMGIPGFRVNFMQPQGKAMEQNLLTGQQMFEGMKAVFDHMESTDCSVVEATMQMLVNRFIQGRLANPGLSCWELQCQAGRVYVAVNLWGDVFSCGTDMMNHRLGHIDDGFNSSSVKSTLCGLHHKDPWYVRCFSCKARRICSQSCPTSDSNSLEYREAECDFTRLMYQYFVENEDRVRKLFNCITTKMPGAHMLR